MEWYTNLIELPWTTIGTVVSALGTAVWSVWSFKHERQEDRKWKQVEFLLDLNQKFFESVEIRECVRTLDNTHQHNDLKRVFESERFVLTSEEILVIEKFRSFLQFFDNLHRCVEMRALTLDQIDLFGWYLFRINEICFIREYCKKSGFKNVIALADSLTRHVYSTTLR
jgi:hypothetical protein